MAKPGSHPGSGTHAASRARCVSTEATRMPIGSRLGSSCRASSGICGGVRGARATTPGKVLGRAASCAGRRRMTRAARRRRARHAARPPRTRHAARPRTLKLAARLARTRRAGRQRMRKLVAKAPQTRLATEWTPTHPPLTRSRDQRPAIAAASVLNPLSIGCLDDLRAKARYALYSVEATGPICSGRRMCRIGGSSRVRLGGETRPTRARGEVEPKHNERADKLKIAGGGRSGSGRRAARVVDRSGTDGPFRGGGGCGGVCACRACGAERQLDGDGRWRRGEAADAPGLCPWRRYRCALAGDRGRSRVLRDHEADSQRALWLPRWSRLARRG